tara:strand:- start:519 stop:1076 length:558 start_codon:yes stop_codon:yes gene_type:complete
MIPIYLNALNNFSKIEFSVIFANAPKAKYVIHTKKIIPIIAIKLIFMFFFHKFNNLMREIIYLFILILSFSCSSTSENSLEGKWKQYLLLEDFEEKLVEPGSVPLISFKSENLVFYYNNLMVYKLTYDSLFLAHEEYPDDVIRSFKIDFLDSEHFNLTFLRKIEMDTFPKYYRSIIYQSQWSKVN